MTFALNLLDNIFFAMLSTLGFALLFNVPKRFLPFCAMLSSLGYASRMILVYFNIPMVFATFFAAMLIGFAGIWVSHRFLAHPKVFTVSAIIPMIPGVDAYKAMINIVQIYQLGFTQALFTDMINHFLNTTFLLGALVFGLAMPSMLFYRQKPVV